MIIKEFSPPSLFDSSYIPESLEFRDDALSLFVSDYHNTSGGGVCLVKAENGSGRTVFPRFAITKELSQDFMFRGIYADMEDLSYQFINSLGYSYYHEDSLTTISNWHMDLTNDCIVHWLLDGVRANENQRFTLILDNVTDNTRKFLKSASKLSEMYNLFVVGIVNTTDYSTITSGKERIKYHNEIPLENYVKEEMYRILKKRLLHSTNHLTPSDTITFIVDSIFQYNCGSSKTSMEALGKIARYNSIASHLRKSDFIRRTLLQMTSVKDDESVGERINYHLVNRHLQALNVVIDFFGQSDHLYATKSMLEEHYYIKCEEFNWKPDKQKFLSSLNLIAGTTILDWSDCKNAYFTIQEVSELKKTILHEQRLRKYNSFLEM